MNNYLYPFFWLHGEEHSVLEECMEKIAGSGMKGACLEARPHPDFVGDGWWSDVSFIIEKAKELDMKLWILDDSHFPTGYANGRVKEDYPQYLKRYLDMRRYDVQGPMKRARIDFSLLKGRPWDKPDPDQKILKVLFAPRVTQENVDGDPIDAERLVDITAQINMDTRLLTLDVPEGAWSIFVVYTTSKGGEDATKDYLNPLVKEATEVLIEEVYEPHYQHFKDEFGKTIQGFFSDEPRFGNIKGTDGYIGRPDMVLPWRDGLEKELGFDEKYLPLLWTDAEGLEKDIRFQYMDVVTELYSKNFTKVLADWCHAHGVWYLGHTIEDNGAHARLGYGTGHYFRGQADMDFAGIDVIGGQIVPGMNYHLDAFNTGGSNGEFYHYVLAKLASSAAHLDPRKKGRAMCEAFGAYGWNEGLKTMKWIADHLLVRGINCLVPHAFDPKKFPDFDCPPHFYAHGHNPQFRYFKVFSDYVNRIADIFRDGVYPSETGLFYPAELEWGGAYMPVEKPARELTTHQVPFDFVTRDWLLEAAVREGFYEINGRQMKTLVIPYAENLPADIVSVLEKMLRNRVKVYFLDKLPEGMTGVNKDPKKFDFVLAHAEVISLKALGNTLADSKKVLFSEEQPDLVVGEYQKNGENYFMIFNENIGRTITTEVTVTCGGTIMRYDAFSGKTYAVDMTENGRCRISFAPYESIILVAGEKNMAAEPLYKASEETLNLPEKWAVSFADSLSYPEFKENVPADTLCCVQEISGWEKKAGTLRFEGSIRMDEAVHAELDLGEVFEIAEVFVNGISAGVRLCKPYRFDLKDLLVQGENQIKIEVTNCLGTALRDPISHYLMIEPFGIEGPVTLKKHSQNSDLEAGR